MSTLAPVVFIVDDDVSIRESLEPLVRTAGWEVETFASAQAFLDYQPITYPCCLILDLSLPDFDGLELQKRMAHEGAGLSIIFISGCGDVPTSVQAMKAGAIDFLTKPFNDEVLLRAIDKAIERSRGAQSEKLLLQTLRTSYSSLSQREREVMGLVVTGLLNKQVGGRLGISEITVKAHRGQVMKKMKAGSFAELVNMSAKILSA